MEIIPLSNLAFAFLPVVVVLVIIGTWGLEYKKSLYAISRMLVQLLTVGYFLAYIFAAESFLIVGLVLTIMLFASSWISLRTMREKKRHFYLKSLLSIAIAGGTILLLMTQVVLEVSPWFSPRHSIPIAGMIFASAVDSISLCAERLEAEMKNGLSYKEARIIAFQASLIPITNSLFAVGLVSFPGMMTGQILSGVSPLIAARYQIMVMCMAFGSAGLASAFFLTLIKNDSIAYKE